MAENTEINPKFTTKLQQSSKEIECYNVNNLVLTEKQRELYEEIQKYEEGSQQKAKGISELQANLTKYVNLTTQDKVAVAQLKNAITRQETELKEQEQKPGLRQYCSTRSIHEKGFGFHR